MGVFYLFITFFVASLNAVHSILALYVFLEMLQTPKASIEVKELKVDISKDGTSKQNLVVKLQILPIVVQTSEPRASCDQSSSFCTGESFSAGQSSSGFMDRSSALFVCEDFSLSCEFGHERYFPLEKYVSSYRYKSQALPGNGKFIVFDS